MLGFVVLLFVAGLAVSGEGGLLERRVRPLLDGLALPPAALLPAIRRTFAVDALLGLAAAGVLAAVLFSKRRATASGYVLGFAALLFALPGGLPLFVSADERDLERPPALAGHSRDRTALRLARACRSSTCSRRAARIPISCPASRGSRGSRSRS